MHLGLLLQDHVGVIKLPLITDFSVSPNDVVVNKELAYYRCVTSYEAHMRSSSQLREPLNCASQLKRGWSEKAHERHMKGEPAQPILSFSDKSQNELKRVLLSFLITCIFLSSETVSTAVIFF